MKVNTLLRFLFLAILILGATETSYGQSDVYVAPPDYFGDDVRISVADMVASKNVYKFKLTIENKSKNKYIVYDIDKTGFDLPEIGKYYPNMRKKPYVIAPDTKKSLIITATAGPEVPVGSFSLLIEGLTMGEIPASPLAFPMVPISSNGSGEGQELETVEVGVEKVSFKKGKYSAGLKIELDQTQNYVNELLIFDPMKVSAKSSGGGTLPIVSSSEKEQKFKPGEVKKIKFDIESEDSEVQIDFSSAFHKLSMTQVEVPAFAISNGRVEHVVKTCPSHTTPVEGSIKINVSSEVGCFKFYMMGEEYTPDYTSSLTFMMNPSSKKVKVVMDDGAIIEKSIYAKADYKALYYSIKRKGTDYNLKYLPLSSEEADKPVKDTPEKRTNDNGASSSGGAPRTCPAQNANISGAVEVQLFSEVGCFKLYAQGALLTNGFTSNFTFNTSENVAKKVRIVMEDGGTAEKTLFIGEGYNRLFFEVKLKKGSYSIKSKLLSAEEAESPQGGTSSGGSSGVQNYDHCKMNYSDFSRLKSSVESESMDDGKLRVANHAARNSCLSVSQIKEIAVLFSFSKQQLDFAKTAYGNCLNRANYYEVLDVFTFEKDKKELDEYIQSH